MVTIVIAITKFSHGAWLVMIAVPLFFAVMIGINRHYRRVDDAMAPAPGGVRLPSRVHAVVLVSRLHSPAMQALAFARATRPDDLVALHVQTDRSDISALQQMWSDRQIPVPLVCLESPYRDLTQPILDLLRQLCAFLAARHAGVRALRLAWQLRLRLAITLKARIEQLADLAFAAGGGRPRSVDRGAPARRSQAARIRLAQSVPERPDGLPRSAPAWWPRD